MRQGHYRVAKAYIQFRDLRTHGRDREQQEAALRAVEPESDSGQQEMVVVRIDERQTILWDGVDLKKRIEFAMLGLDLCLTRSEIEHELRRSLTGEISQEHLKQTVILNAKSLMEQDADFAKFAARILLSY